MPLKLEVFDTTPAEAPLSATVVTDQGSLVEARLEAYDKGYVAGWEDAAAAVSDEAAQVRAELGRSLQSLAFTFQEARTHVLQAIEPVILQLVSRVLPEAARSGLGQTILDHVLPLVRQAAEAEIRVMVHPSQREAAEDLLSATPGLPVVVGEEPTLGPGQARLLLGQTETRIDLDAALDEIGRLTRDFFTLAKKETRHG